jgi:hypothetical protein
MQAASIFEFSGAAGEQDGAMALDWPLGIGCSSRVFALHRGWLRNARGSRELKTFESESD